MFVLTKERRVLWPVVIDEPMSGGNIQRRKIEVEFIVLDADEWGDDTTVMDALRRVVVNWKHIEDPDGAPVAFSDDALTKLLLIPYVRAAIWMAYTTEVQSGAAAKN